jgi:KDO2-lipid IV(A) lauroyltransferase
MRPVTLRERIEAGFAAALMALFRALPLDAASALGGWLARTVGPQMGITKRARRNLARALPELTPVERERAIRKMWDNLGRVIAEYPHLDRIQCFVPGSRIETIGTEHVDRAMARGKPVIFVSAHFGNWEAMGVAAVQYGMKVALIYRAPNNPLVAKLMEKVRKSFGSEPIPKGAKGARRIIEVLKTNTTLGIMIDQKMNDGIPVPFFGRDAWTAPGAVELAMRYDCTILPVRANRVDGAHFRLIISPPIEIPRTGDRHADIYMAMLRINHELESWIRDDPGQWFWLHRRWPDD